jgi:cellobiose phosphorylase
MQPALGLLTNGSYAVMITNAGAGYSSWRDLDVTRWREDATRDCWGHFFYIRDLSVNRIWSIGAPLLHAPDAPDFLFLPDRAEFYRRDGDIETRCTVCVVPDVDAEVRAITLANPSGRSHEIELTSYAEVCLNDRRADRSHPAFAKLFLETEFDDRCGALLVRRRPRGAKERPVWAMHASTTSLLSNENIEYETDRTRFLGRGRTPANPAALNPTARLSRTTGPVLDPIFSLRRRITVEAGSTIQIAFVTAAAESREIAIGIADRFREFEATRQAFAGADARCQSELREFALSPDSVALFNRLASSIVFTNPGLRDLEAVASNRLGQPRLWPYGISGDLPIVLVRVGQSDDEALVRPLLQWRAYMRVRGLKFDLVILDKRENALADRLRKELETAIAPEPLGKPGGVFFLTIDKVPEEDAVLLAAASRIVLGDDRGSLKDQIDRGIAAASEPMPLFSAKSVSVEPAAKPERSVEALRFWNGFGGFNHDGREYVIVVDAVPGGPGLPPAPWTNVLANPRFGCLVTEAGLGYTWAGNSQMNRLTPWSNDPTSDPPSEIVYLRDEETGDSWTPTPLPLGPHARVTVRHGQGYTRYTHTSRGVDQDVSVFVPVDDPIKLVCLTLRNNGNRPRSLSATYYLEWVLGTTREDAPLRILCERDAKTGAILAKNPWAGDFAERIAFVACGSPVQSVTADRAEFLGRRGSISTADALKRAGLSGRVGAGLDPCAAMRTDLTLSPGETGRVVFVLGQADDLQDLHRLISQYTQPDQADAALTLVQQQWDRCLSALHVTTPDPAIDLMLNRWLLYQVLACRVWARSAFYQSGGAYGFRDQLQDVMALVYSVPAEARAQILRSAERQFEEGDVQHWWHPPSGAGVRTRITDDLYFLPLVVHHYVVTTGDTGILDEGVPFIVSPVLREDQEEDFNSPAVSRQSSSLYDHCMRALKYGYRLGSHGLPLMGTGDWNDGMNKVGSHGKGESVWNGWFFVSVLSGFAELAEQRSQADADWCRERVEQLRTALEEHAWDGAWYRRAYFDDGTPLGSAQNDECRIDAIPQAWAVISGAANPARAQSAMNAVQKHLVRVDDQLIQLFDPPFDEGRLHPGYIKGYVPGIRENGGQYTHAATWVVLATALQGQADRAIELWRLINPIHHATTMEAVTHYKVEPYVVCADVYGAPPHTGRGGWTWYTGSAGWLYRVAIEAILGFHLRGDTLRVEPCVPPAWPGFELSYRHHSATYRIVVDNSAGKGRGIRTVELDGQELPNDAVPLADDSRTHTVRVRLG